MSLALSHHCASLQCWRPRPLRHVFSGHPAPDRRWFPPSRCHRSQMVPNPCPECGHRRRAPPLPNLPQAAARPASAPDAGSAPKVWKGRKYHHLPSWRRSFSPPPFSDSGTASRRRLLAEHHVLILIRSSSQILIRSSSQRESSSSRCHGTHSRPSTSWSPAPPRRVCSERHHPPHRVCSERRQARIPVQAG